ncbi:MAG: type II toxin-antitoxin system RelE/ParE family toxin [Actinomycetaceae bacterium]|nr:type II toxin-antitoxin system RelE/ParE family toxin [Actinomycetaceae bacterium]
MSWRVLFLDDAKRELEQIYLWELEDTGSVERAQKVVDRILDAGQALAQAPFAHMLHPTSKLEGFGVRYEVVAGRHVIYFVPDEEKQEIRIYHILHRRANASSRSWG